jgi:hypothetical protein
MNLCNCIATDKGARITLARQSRSQKTGDRAAFAGNAGGPGQLSLAATVVFLAEKARKRRVVITDLFTDLFPRYPCAFICG